MDENDKLKIVPVTVLYRTKLHTVISGDISKGERLVLNDLLPAVEGMSLADKTDMAITGEGAGK